ncbi:MAG: family NAD(P)-dependent oxidoreductase [Mycobacterium sp.]|nr:family NAD(P)-dependent oxidoreductase [Mycobacterium sp.]
MILEQGFTDRSVAVLGGTAGVGLETATQFAERGARVALFGRDRERGAATCAKIALRAPQGDVHFIRSTRPIRTMQFGRSRNVVRRLGRSTCW